MDIAWVLQYLMPSPQFGGAFDLNTQEEYDNIRWNDEREKPLWSELVEAWPRAQALMVPIPALLAETLRLSALQLTNAGVVLTEQEATIITSVSVALRDLALWAPSVTFNTQARALISGLPTLRAELEPIKNLMLSQIP